VSPNPAIDRSVIVPDFRPYEVNRSTSVIEAAGGKGINVARSARILGGEILCVGFLAGESGRHVAHLAQAEGLAAAWTWIEGETRTCTIVVDPNSGRATVVNESGPTVTADDWLHLKQGVIAAGNGADIICVCGSAPPGTSSESYADVLLGLRDFNVPVWADASGMTLRAALTVPGIGIKVNHEEIGALVGQSVENPQDAVGAAQKVREKGIRVVIVTLGADGAVIAHENGQWWAKPPTIRAVSGVGSGDSFMAGYAVASAEGENVSDALRWATAAGAANALSVGGGQFTRTDFEQLLRGTMLVSL
jgi:1-phosphofructokinase family hexose kinase